MAQVLVVESDHNVRAAIGFALTEAGYAVLEADTGIAALTLMAANDHPLAVVLDLQLPDLDGMQVVRFAGNALRPDWAAGMVLMSSDGHTPQLLADGRRRARAPQVLLNPFDLDALLAAVRLVDGRLHPRRRPVAQVKAAQVGRHD